MTKEEQIRGFHRALHIACGLPPIAPSMGNQRVWWEFLKEMEGLNEPEIGGPLDVTDIQDVIGEMKRQNKAQQANWALRPSKILRDPETFRDLVLMSRKRRQARPQKPATAIVEQQAGTARRQVEVPVQDDPVPVSELLATLRDHMS